MSESSKKGLLVEQVVAKLHETPGVTIQTRIKLPPKSGRGKLSPHSLTRFMTRSRTMKTTCPASYNKQSMKI